VLIQGFREYDTRMPSAAKQTARWAGKGSGKGKKARKERRMDLVAARELAEQEIGKVAAQEAVT